MHNLSFTWISMRGFQCLTECVTMTTTGGAAMVTLRKSPQCRRNTLQIKATKHLNFVVVVVVVVVVGI